MSKVAYVYDGATSSWVSFSGPPADSTPTGVVSAFAGSVAPNAWLLCNGQEVSRTTYSALFALIGTTYGSGNGTSTFNVPNLKGRVIVGSDSTQTEFNTLGEIGGSKTSVAPHTHAVDHDHASFTSGNDNTDHSHSGTTGTVSSDHSHTINAYRTNNEAAGRGAPSSTSFTDRVLVNTSGGQGTNGISANHTHSFGTGGRSAFHAHSIDVPAFTGASGAASAEATSGNLQPYLVMNYIIKI